MPQIKLSSLSVLIVDDVSAMRRILKTILRGLGITEVLEASDGQAALEVLKCYSVDVVITDICMKPMDGNEFIKRLRQPGNGLNPYVPILVLSAHSEVSLVKNALESGANFFLCKPVTSAKLEERLNAMLSAPCPPVRSAQYCGPDRRRRATNTRKCRRETDGEITLL